LAEKLNSLAILQNEEQCEKGTLMSTKSKTLTSHTQTFSSLEFKPLLFLNHQVSSPNHDLATSP